MMTIVTDVKGTGLEPSLQSRYYSEQHAQLLGIGLARLIGQLYFLTKKSISMGFIADEDGYMWIKHSDDDFARDFPSMGIRTIKRHIYKLWALGIVKLSKNEVKSGHGNNRCLALDMNALRAIVNRKACPVDQASQIHPAHPKSGAEDKYSAEPVVESIIDDDQENDIKLSDEQPVDNLLVTCVQPVDNLCITSAPPPFSVPKWHANANPLYNITIQNNKKNNNYYNNNHLCFFSEEEQQDLEVQKLLALGMLIEHHLQSQIKADRDTIIEKEYSFIPNAFRLTESEYEALIDTDQEIDNIPIRRTLN